MEQSCLILPFETADGAANMALDEAMLDAVGADPSIALLRTYGWTEPTLSLGYFQTLEEARADARWGSVPLVRRPTGGGAIWHHHELTYALALPRDHRSARRSEDLYRAVHTAIAEFLRPFGVVARRRGDERDRGIQHARPFLCFTDRDAEDIVAVGFKVVGSAQRRRSGAVLQHGSLLLKSSAITPELKGVGDLVPSNPDAHAWSRPLVNAIAGALGLRSEEGPASRALRQRARELEGLRYRNPDWTARR